jgi:hypothetical protein
VIVLHRSPMRGVESLLASLLLSLPLVSATTTRLSHLSQLIDRLPIRRMAAEPTNALRGSS